MVILVLGYVFLLVLVVIKCDSMMMIFGLWLGLLVVFVVILYKYDDFVLILVVGFILNKFVDKFCVLFLWLFL